jgi:MFS family permease
MNKKIFGTLFFSQFAVITGVGIVVPLLPVYAHELGASGFLIGMIFGVFAISRSCFLPYFGRLSDIKGRKPFILAGLMSYSLISIAFMFSTGIFSLIFIRFIQGIASAMIMPVVQAYVGEIAPIGKEGFIMGLLNISVFASLSFGPVAGGIIKDHFNLQSSFAAMGIFAFIGFLLALFFLPPVSQEKSVYRKCAPVKWNQLLKDRELTGLFIFRFSYTTCIGIIWAFLPVFADIEFGLSSSLIGILIMLGVFINGVMQVPMGYIADRANRRTMILLGGIITTFAMYSFEWAGGFWGLFFCQYCFWNWRRNCNARNFGNRRYKRQ